MERCRTDRALQRLGDGVASCDDAGCVDPDKFWRVAGYSISECTSARLSWKPGRRIRIF